jgi:hypothetical protein
MMRDVPPRCVIALGCALLVAACSEDEKSCYDRISADLTKTMELANKRGDAAYGLIAAESNISATVIYNDDDRSICDYVTAGAYLERK